MRWTGSINCAACAPNWGTVIAAPVRVIHCCGYDSIPSDLGAMVVVNKAKEMGKKIQKVTTIVGDSRGGVSGGTIASGMNISADPELRKKDKSMYSYIPDKATNVPGTDADAWTPRFCKATQQWLAPFVMQAVNTRVVQRSNYLLNWGKEKFSYAEHMGVKSRFQAWAVSAATGMIGIALSQPWLHPLVSKMVPAPGQGPSREKMMTGYYNHTIVGETTDGGVIMGTFSDKHRDPGYWGTSRLLLEAALCLALQKKALDACPDVLKGGVLTPASGLGPVLRERLEKAGIECHCVDFKGISNS